MDEKEMGTETVSQHRPSKRSMSASLNISQDDHSAEIDLKDFLFMLWRRKGLILLIILMFTALGWLIINMIQPRYTAEALVKIENMNERSSLELRQMISNFKLDTTVILSEVQVISSRSMARQVIQKYGLVADPELNPLLTQKPDPERKYNFIGLSGKENLKTELLADTQIKSATDSNMPPEVTDRLMGVIVNNFLDNVKVYPISGSYVIQVEYTSEDPVKAAKITNAIIDTYLDRRLQLKANASQKITDWLDERLATLRDQIRISEAAVEAYRKEKNLVVGSRAEITAQSLSELNTQLVVAKAKLAEAMARLSQIEEARGQPSRLQTASEVLDSNLVSQLKIRESDLQRTLSELSERYGPKHPSIINAKKELRELRSDIDNEIDNVLRGIENEVEVAEARVAALEADLTEMEGKRTQENQDMIRLRELMREAESNRLIYEKFLEQNKATDQQEQLQEPEAQIISYATVPSRSSYPNIPLFLSLSAAVALFFSIGVCFLLEKFDNAFRSAIQIENATGRPCFAMIPRVTKLTKTQMADFIVNKPASGLAESVRTLRTVLKLRAGSEGNRPKVVSITSSFPGEGKTTLSAWLGRISAKAGEKVIVIDCDLRRPALQNGLPGRGDKTLVEYLTGQAKLEDIIEKDSATGLHKIYARSVPNSALDLIDSDRMRNLIQSLRKVYDLVIIDTPACLAVSDAGVLTLMSDYALYCVHWDHTPREVVEAGVKQFTDIGYNDVAFVLTNVDISKHAKYGYGETPYYYSRDREYYDN